MHYANPSGKHLIGNCFIFQYHNDPKHTANASEIIFGEKNKTLTVMDWPPESRPEYYRGSLGSPGQGKK